MSDFLKRLALIALRRLAEEAEKSARKRGDRTPEGMTGTDHRVERPRRHRNSRSDFVRSAMIGPDESPRGEQHEGRSTGVDDGKPEAEAFRLRPWHPMIRDIDAHEARIFADVIAPSQPVLRDAVASALELGCADDVEARFSGLDAVSAAQVAYESFVRIWLVADHLRRPTFQKEARLLAPVLGAGFDLVWWLPRTPNDVPDVPLSTGQLCDLFECIGHRLLARDARYSTDRELWLLRGIAAPAVLAANPALRAAAQHLLERLAEPAAYFGTPATARVTAAELLVESLGIPRHASRFLRELDQDFACRDAARAELSAVVGVAMGEAILSVIDFDFPGGIAPAQLVSKPEVERFLAGDEASLRRAVDSIERLASWPAQHGLEHWDWLAKQKGRYHYKPILGRAGQALVGLFELAAERVKLDDREIARAIRGAAPLGISRGLVAQGIRMMKRGGPECASALAWLQREHYSHVADMMENVPGFEWPLGKGRRTG